MALFLVERTLSGITPEQLQAAAGAAKSTSQAMTAEGTAVHYHRSTFLPVGDRCFCLFESDSAETVRAVQERAGLPFDHIHDAQHIAAEQLP